MELSPDVDEELLTHVLYNSMLFFRDYQFTEVTEALYELLKDLELSEYDQQKITLSHFSSHLVSRELDKVEEAW